MKFIALVTIVLAFLVAAGVAHTSAQGSGHKCSPAEKADVGLGWTCWTDGTFYIYVHPRGCVAAFSVHPGEPSEAWFEIRTIKHKLVDIEEIYDSVYSYCGLTPGQYYKIQTDAYYYDYDYDEVPYYSPWVRFKVPVK